MKGKPNLSLSDVKRPTTHDVWQKRQNHRVLSTNWWRFALRTSFPLDCVCNTPYIPRNFFTPRSCVKLTVRPYQIRISQQGGFLALLKIKSPDQWFCRVNYLDYFGGRRNARWEICGRFGSKCEIFEAPRFKSRACRSDVLPRKCSGGIGRTFNGHADPGKKVSVPECRDCRMSVNLSAKWEAGSKRHWLALGSSLSKN